MSAACVDRLDVLLNRFPVRTQTFHAGALCGITDFNAPDEIGQMHLVMNGAVTVLHAGHPPVHITEPSLLLFPRPLSRRFVTDSASGAELVCAELHFEGRSNNPIARALPEMVCLPLSDIEGARPVLALLFEEAFTNRCGKRVLVDRLFEVVLIQVLRQLMENASLNGGMLAGLAHLKLRQAIVAMHEAPQNPWSLDMLADVAGMSRSVFANTFRDTVGQTPGQYLQEWRVRLAQQAFKLGRPLKMVAIEVGYGSEAALSRAFKAQLGLTPREWRQLHFAAD